MRGQTRWIAAALVVLGAAPRVYGGQAAPQQAFVDIVVNDVPAGEHVVRVRAGGEVLMTAEALEATGLTRLRASSEEIDGVRYVSLRSAAPVLQYQLDDVGLELRITADASLFPTQHVTLGPAEPAGVHHASDAGAFLNYAATMSSDGSSALVSEIGVTIGPGVLTSTGSWHPGRRPVAGVASFTFDDRRRMQRLVVGETSVPGTGFAGGRMLAGISVSREFSLNPYFSRYPAPELSAAVATPSTAEVYVDGRLVRRLPVLPGTFDLTGIPAMTGPGRTRVVVRDAFGRDQSFGASYYTSTTLLARGLTDYQYALGFERTTSSGGAPAYGDPVFVARHRVGITSGLSAGLGAQASRRQFSLAPAISFAARRAGQFELSAYAVAGHGRSAHAGAVAWSYAARAIGVGLSLRGEAGDSFQGTVSSGSRVEATAFVGLPLGGRLSTTIQEQRLSQHGSDAGLQVTSRSAALTTLRINTRTHVLLNLAVDKGRLDRHVVDAFIGLSVRTGPRGTALIGLDRQGSSMDPSVEVQESRPPGEGLGYRIHGADASNPSHVMGEYAGRHGLYGAESVVSGGTTVSTAQTSGAIVLTRRGVAFTRTVEEGYAVVSVPGVPGVRVRLNNLDVGRTDARGNLLVPSLLSNYGNRITIEDADIPGGYTVPEAELLVAPSARGAASAVFSVTRMHAASGRIVLGTGFGTGHRDDVPSGGLLTIDDGALSSPLGINGEFFFEQLSQGRHTGVVHYLGRSYGVTLVVSAGTDDWLDCGELVAEALPR